MALISFEDRKIKLFHVMKFLVCIVDRAEYAFKPKDLILNKKPSSPIDAGKLTESEIKQRINRLSQTLANKVLLNSLLWLAIYARFPVKMFRIYSV